MKLIRVTVEATHTYRREVVVQVDETDERLKDAKRWPSTFEDEAKDAAQDYAKRGVAGWEHHGEPEYRAVAWEKAEPGVMVDVAV